MDLVKYARNYKGNLKLKRLLFIVQNGKNDSIKRNAFHLVLSEMKKGINTQIYKETIEKFAKKLDPSMEIDRQWVNRTDSSCGKKLQELELEFNTYKTSSLKEKVRKASIALGEFYYRRGEFQNALKRFLRVRDYVATPQHISEMCLLIIKAAIELDNFAVTSQYLSRARQVCDANDAMLVSKLSAISGLVDLHNGSFKSAARKFLKIDISIHEKFNEIISCRDVAFYGCVLGVATFSRKELKNELQQNESEKKIAPNLTLIDNPMFQNFTDFCPVVKKFAENFYESKYSIFLKQLGQLKEFMDMDLYLRLYCERIHTKIRNKALCQYVSPFNSIDLKKMAKAFEMELDQLEREIVRLIQNKEIKGKIDSHKKILYSKPVEKKQKTFTNVIEYGDEFVKDTENAILRMNMRKYKNFVIQPLRKGPKGKSMEED